MKPPLCRYCGNPIPKRTETVWFAKSGAPGRLDADPHTKAEAQRLTNGRVVYVRRYGESIAYASVWDGESYVSPYFCSDVDAKRFGNAAAAMMEGDGPKIAMPAFWTARKLQDAL